MIKRKECTEEGCSSPRWSKGLCQMHHRLAFPEKYQIKSRPNKAAHGTKSVGGSKCTLIKKSTTKRRKPTGELKLFLSIYADRGGRCEITGKQIPFDVNNFAHILSKGAYPSYRLKPDNIIHIKPDIHHLYDNSSKEKLLERYPAAIKIYDMKDRLRYQYYNS